MDEACKISTSISFKQDFLLGRWNMAETSQDWGLVRLGNQKEPEKLGLGRKTNMTITACY